MQKINVTEKGTAKTLLPNELFSAYSIFFSYGTPCKCYFSHSWTNECILVKDVAPYNSDDHAVLALSLDMFLNGLLV